MLHFNYFNHDAEWLSTRQKKKSKHRKISFGQFLWISLTLVHFREVWTAPHRSPWRIRATVIQMQWGLNRNTLRSSGSGLHMNKEQNVISVLLEYFWLLNDTTWEARLAENTPTAVFVLKCDKATSGFLHYPVNGTSHTERQVAQFLNSSILLLLPRVVREKLNCHCVICLKKNSWDRRFKDNLQWL